MNAWYSANHHRQNSETNNINGLKQGEAVMQALGLLGANDLTDPNDLTGAN